MKLKRKPVISILLCFSLIFTCGAFDYKNAKQTKAVEQNLSNPTIKNSIITWDCIYFGNYWQNDTNEDGDADQNDAKEPVKWRVLSVDETENRALIMSDKVLDCQPYNTNVSSVVSTSQYSCKWENASIRYWLNNDFFNDCFNTSEKNAIIEGAYGDAYSYLAGVDVSNKVFFLSSDEATSSVYGLNTMKARQCKISDYAKRNGWSHESIAAFADNCYWWLCREEVSEKALYMDSTGSVKNNTSTKVTEDEIGARPVTNIDLNSSVWSYAGTVDSNGNIGDSSASSSTPTPSVSPTPTVTVSPSPTPSQTTQDQVSNPTIKDSVTTWDCIYFGKYWQVDTDGDGDADQNDAKQPIKWRVLSVNGNDAFLMADKILDVQPYNTKYVPMTWENSSLRKWLNETFYENAFTEDEKNSIQTSTVKNENNPRYSTSSNGGNDTEDKVYLLSINESLNTDYGFDQNITTKNTRIAEVTNYADSFGGIVSGNIKNWWLRSPGSLEIMAAYINVDGTFSYGGTNIDANTTGIRPVLHVDLSSDVWSDAGTVKSSDAATTTPSPTPTPSISPTPTVITDPTPTPSQATQDQVSNPRIKKGITTWDCIYFGKYWQKDTNGDGNADQNDAKQPIKWRVLSVDGNDAFLLADQNLDCQPYNTSYVGVTWETCTLRTWLNNTFYKAAFNSTEKEVIQTTTVTNADNPTYRTEGGNNTEDKVYLLSLDEVCNEAYGFNDVIQTNVRGSSNTDYLDAIEKYSLSWWLRSPGYSSKYAARVSNYGYLGDSGTEVSGINNVYDSVRPALHIDLSSSVWSYAGTVNSEENTDDSPTSSPTPTPSASPTSTVTTSPTPTSVVTTSPSPTPAEIEATGPSPTPAETELITPALSASSDVLSDNSSNTASEEISESDIYQLKAVVKKGQKKVRLTWKKIKNATSYQIRYSTDKNLKTKMRYKIVKKNKATLKKSKKKKYYVQVRACFTKNNTTTFKKWSTKLVTLSKVKSLKKKKNNGKITVSWKKVKQANGYQICYSNDKNLKKNLTYKNVKKNKITLKQDGKCYIKVRAFYKKNKSKSYGIWIKKII